MFAKRAYDVSFAKGKMIVCGLDNVWEPFPQKPDTQRDL